MTADPVNLLAPMHADNGGYFLFLATQRIRPVMLPLILANTSMYSAARARAVRASADGAAGAAGAERHATARGTRTGTSARFMVGKW